MTFNWSWFLNHYKRIVTTIALIFFVVTTICVHLSFALLLSMLLHARLWSYENETWFNVFFSYTDKMTRFHSPLKVKCLKWMSPTFSLFFLPYNKNDKLGTHKFLCRKGHSFAKSCQTHSTIQVPHIHYCQHK